ncbi:MAG: MarR family winged helix-turn-helix transcriptional regulator [Deltaproteobacteria bacterium]|jgi:DNA-binding MarR family transcriptional regulator|nr:MarR family winged helix-turn-helix transcriptional regulator [Deltaproteobacteria bacterium]
MGTKKTKKFSPCYCLRIRLATGVVTEYYDRILAPSGVTVNQFAVLFNISRHEGCSVKQLADISEHDSSTLARNLKPLYRDGLIADTKEPGSRNSRLKLTPAGQKTLEAANPLWNKAQESLSKKLGQENLKTLEKLLVSLSDL